MNTEVMFSSDKSCWETPRALFEQLDAEFHFTLDAAKRLEELMEVMQDG